LWGSPQEIERRRRILVSVWAYAYEIMDDPIVSDSVFDTESRAIDLNKETGDDALDFWFSENFNPDTGQWVHDHPDKTGLHKWYLRMSKT
jgi:hypothetical protein